MNGQIQVQPIQSSELTQSTQKVEVDSQLFESMLNQQQPDSQQNAEEVSDKQKTDKKDSTYSEIKQSTDKDKVEEPPINLGPFLIEMISQETEIATQLGLSTEELDATMNKVLNESKDLSPKEQKVIDKLIDHFKAQDTDEQAQTLTSRPNRDSDLKLQNPVFYQKQVLENKLVNPEVLLEQIEPEQEPRDLERYLNQLNRNTFKDSKQLVENSKLLRTEIPVELSNEVPKVKLDKTQSILSDSMTSSLEKMLPKRIPEIVAKEKSLSQISQPIERLNESDQSIEINTLVTDRVEKNITSSSLSSNMLSERTDEIETSTEVKTTVVDTSKHFISYSRLTAEQIDETTTTNQVIEKKDLDVIKSMITEKIQNLGKPETLRSTIKLTPETLGKVTVEIDLVNNKLVGRLIVATSEAKVLVEQQLKSQTLNQPSQALQLDKIEVSVMPVQNAFDAAFNFSDQQQSSHFAQPMKNKKGYTAKEEQELEGSESLDLERNVSGRLNVMA